MMNLFSISLETVDVILLSEYTFHYLCFMARAVNQAVALCCGDAARTGNRNWGQEETTAVEY